MSLRINLNTAALNAHRQLQGTDNALSASIEKLSSGYRINRALIEEMQVLPDFREPDNIRLGLAPLYTSFAELWEAVARIRQVVVEERYLNYSAKRLRVT